ncbi:MAG: hypothetical protein ABEJ56_04090 [Candidatus Nanohaloarchaea archaeon]
MRQRKRFLLFGVFVAFLISLSGAQGSKPGKISPSTEITENREKTDLGQQDSLEMDYTLPEKTDPLCRERIKKMRQRYMERIRKNPESKSELRKEFYSRVENKLTSCRPGPRLANVSEAPKSMTEGCKDRVRELNQKIQEETNASIGDRVPEKYQEEYRKALKGCVVSTVVHKVVDKMMRKILGSRSDLFDPGLLIERIGDKVGYPEMIDSRASVEEGKVNGTAGSNPEKGKGGGPLASGLVGGLSGFLG